MESYHAPLGVTGLTDRVQLALRAGGMVAIAVGVRGGPWPGSATGRAVAAAAVALTVAAWLTWLVAFRAHPRAGVASATTYAVAGAVLAALTWPGPAIAIPAVGATVLGRMAPTRVAVAGTAVVEAAFALSMLALHADITHVLGYGAIPPFTLLLGLSRRQRELRVEEAEMRLADMERARAEHARAAALAERSRLAREIHDVLAHTLAGLSLQLEAADALLSGDAASVDAARAHVGRARSLAAAGMAETRRAISALRDDVRPLPDRIAALVDGSAAAFRVEGAPRSLPSDAEHALFRAAQEGITNARKHAPGEPVRVALRYGDGAVTVSVANPGDGAHAGTPGYGIIGLRERAALLGGTVTAGRTEEGWTLELALPV